MCRFSLIEPRHGQWIWGRLTEKLATADEDAAGRMTECDARASHQVGLLRPSTRPTHHAGRFCCGGQQTGGERPGVRLLPAGDCSALGKPSGPYFGAVPPLPVVVAGVVVAGAAGLVWLMVMMAQVAVKGFPACRIASHLQCFSLFSGTRSTSSGSGCSRSSI